LYFEPLEYRRLLTTATITSVNPAFPVASSSAQTFTINGSNFASGCTVTLSDLGTSPITTHTYTNSAISSLTSTQIVINPILGTAHDVWGVQVTNSGSSASNQFNFAITPASQPQPDRFGVDYSFARPAPSSLQAGGSTFAVRYVSNSGNGKNITLSEAQSLLAAGQDIIIVFETTTNEILNGYSAGAADADTAVSEATAAGAPSNFFCYFACDFDASSSQYAAIDAYLNGAASVMGVSRVGLYAGIGPVSHALAAGTASKGWQATAWSGGNVASGISLFQFYLYSNFFSGDCDADVGFGADIGQWTPAGLTATATGSQTASISWTTTSVATSCTLDRATSSSGPWTPIYTGTNVSFNDSGLQSGTKYYYEVRFNNGSGSSSFSPSVWATTLPAVPTGLAATATGSQAISITWNTTTGATTYILQRSTSATGTYSSVYSGSTAQYSDTTVQPGTTYYYKVCAGNSTGNSAYSSYVSATTWGGVPTGLNASATGAQSISITWNTVTGATSYALQRSTSASGTYTSVYSGAAAQYTDTTVQPGTIYYYEVSSSTNTVTSAYSSPDSTITYPAIPTGLSATASGPKTMSISWNAMTGAATYLLQRSTSQNGPWTQVYSNSTAQFADSNLQVGTTYYYEVLASNSSGSTAYSAAVSASTSPNLTITSPTNGQVFASYLLTVNGTASDTGGSGLSKVIVTDTTNGNSNIELLSGASASYAVSGIALAIGQNVINVQIIDRSGYRSSIAAVTVTYSPPTWTGGGANGNWTNAANWSGTTPAAGSDLVFDGSTGLNNTNDLAAATQFGNLTFNASAGAFALNGNSVNLSGVMTNNSTNAETINLSLGGAYVLTKAGSGTVVLSGSNTFTGGTVVSAGTLNVTTPAALPDGSDLSIGANVVALFGAPTVPAAPAADSAPTASPSVAAPSSTAAATDTQAPSTGGAPIPAALVNHLARNAARSSTWADMLNSNGQQDSKTRDLRAWDAVLADYGRE
jgi:autotransporter-associated beta strand protein